MESNKTIIFGVRPVMEAISSEQQIERIYVRRDLDGGLIGQLRQMAKEYRVGLQDVPAEKLDRMTRGNHQGVVAKISPIQYRELSDVMEAVEASGETPLIVVLDSVTDVRNFGAIARSAECAGAHALVVSLKNAAPVNADAIKTSAGALNIIPVCRTGSIRNTIKYLQSLGLQAVAATEKSNTILFETDMTKPTVIIMGSEDTGISKEVLKLCDVQLAIPLVGNIESLNVSAAATVMLFEVVRQRIDLN